MTNLRPYQAEAVDAAEAALARGERATLLALAVGTGKSWLIAELARRAVDRGQRPLVLAHRQELLGQDAAKMAALGAAAALEKGDQRAGLDARAVVGSVQSFSGRRLAAWPRDHFDLIVVDEAHRALAASYRAILDHFEGARVVGLTGTPSRSDGQGLGEVFESCAFSFPLREAIAAGWLVPLRARRVIVEGVNLDRVRRVHGDLDAGDLEREFTSPEAVRGVVRPLLELGEGRRAIVFGASVAHAELLAAEINRHEPGAAETVSGETPPEVRRDVLARFQSGGLRVATCRDLWVEGLDVPPISLVALARPTSSRIVLEQSIGRGTRLSPETGKADCLILDFTATTARHALVSPADLLAGSGDSSEVIARAAEKEGDVAEALEQARRELGESVVTRYMVEAVNLFGEQLELRFDDPLPPTSRQVEVLVGAGLPPPAELSRQAASALIGALIARRDRGLCTFKQARLLKRQGIDPTELTFDEAGKAIAKLKARWSRRTSGGRA